MGRRGRPSLKGTDYSKLNYKRMFDDDKKALLLNLLSKAPRGMTIKEISKKFASYKPSIQKYLNELIRINKITGPYYDIYFHNRYIKGGIN